MSYSFETSYLSVVVVKVRKYVESNRSFRYVHMKHYFGDSSRCSLPDVLDNS